MSNFEKLTCRDKLLAEYREDKFNPLSKLSDGEDGKKYLSVVEKIRMFRADYPEGSIICEVLHDDNIFASVRCIVECCEGKAEAIGKWYHSNNDVFGMNYLKTAEINAVSTALRLLGYEHVEFVEPEPDGSKNVSEFLELPPPFDPNTFNEYSAENGNGNIKQGSQQQLKPAKKNNELTVEQARTFKIPNPPFMNRTIGEIIDGGVPDEISKLKEHLAFAVNYKLPLAPAAKAILPTLEG